MITQITIYYPNQSSISYVVGKDGVEKIFHDREKEDVIVVVCEDGIQEFSGMKYQATKARKEIAG